MKQEVPGFPGVQHSTLRRLARKYIWWKQPDEVLQNPDRIIVQIMNIGDYDDVLALLAEAGEPAFRQVLQRAGPGQLTPRSWNYWHVRLGLVRPGEAPPQPVRRFR